jgi:fructoselysine 6-phosphate deglycase
MFEIDLSKPKQIVADVLKDHQIDSVAFVGCGASMSELYPAKYFLANNTRTLNVQLFTANEFNYDTPAWVGPNTFVVTCSLGGTTPETVKANGTAKALGAPVTAITHNATSPLTEGVDHVIVHGFEKNYAAKVEKMGYALALAVELLQQVEGTDLYEDMVNGLNKVYDLAEGAAEHAGKLASAFAADFKDDQLIYVLGSGASAKVAYSTSMFLFSEMQWLDSAAYNSGEYFPRSLRADREGQALPALHERWRDPPDGRACAHVHAAL